MMTQKEDQDNAAPRSLFLIQALVNTQYGGRGRYAHSELTSPEHLRTWLIKHDVIVDGTPVTEGDLRRVLLLREALRSLLQTNNGAVVSAEQVDALNHLARNASLTVRFARDGQATLEPDIAGVDGALAHLVGIVFTAMRDGTWSRLKVCHNAHCQKAFYDTSKNRSRVWCSMALCGSRLKARAYRQRRTGPREE